MIEFYSYISEINVLEIHLKMTYIKIYNNLQFKLCN